MRDLDDLLGTDAMNAADAFDDVMGNAPAVSLADSVAATHAIVREAAADRRPPAPVKVVPVDADAPPDPYADALESVLADCVDDDGDLFRVPGPMRFPMLCRLYRQHRSAMPDPRPVRVDTEQTYALYRAGRHGYASAVAELAQALADHAADGHGGRVDSGRLRALASDLSQLRDEIVGAEVPLSLPPYARGKVHCWEDGTGVCCSIRLPGPDGRPRIATTCTPIEPHVHDVLGYVEDAGIDPGCVLGALPTIARMLGGGSLIPQLAKVAPQLLAHPDVHDQDEPVFGKMVANGSASLAAVMALMQAAQLGDHDAQDEMAALAVAASEDDALADLLTDAAHRLGTGQARKRGGATVLGWTTGQFQIEDSNPRAVRR